MIQAMRVLLSKKSLSGRSISLRVELSERTSTAKSGAPRKKPRVERRKPSALRGSRLTNEMSGARQLRFFIQKPVLESKILPKRLASAKALNAVANWMQISP